MFVICARIIIFLEPCIFASHCTGEVPTALKLSRYSGGGPRPPPFFAGRSALYWRGPHRLKIKSLFWRWSTASSVFAGRSALYWRGPHRLKIKLLFWRWSTASPFFSGRSARTSHSLFLPRPHPLSPSLISHLASVDVMQHVHLPCAFLRALYNNT